MNANLKQSLAILLVMSLIFIGVESMNAQILKIQGHITLDKVSSFDRYTVKVLDTEKDSVIAEFKDFKTFSYTIGFNKEYTVVISKEGYKSKSIFFNTTCSDKSQPFKYVFDCNLEKNPDSKDDSVCQAGGVFYNEDKQNFDFYYHR